MKYYLFIDESGDHGLTVVNPDFPVFLLCGILLTEHDYENIRQSLDQIKRSIWSNKEVIFHSRDIRKCEKEFQILFDLDKKKLFYEELNKVLAGGDYKILASAIKKDTFIRQFGKLSDDVYEIALSFIIDRAVSFLDNLNEGETSLQIVIEKRGRAEDKKLDEHFQRLMSRGTGYVSAEKLRIYQLSISFQSKKENINGLQLADLIAYPTARYVLEPDRANPAYEVFESKFYSKGDEKIGLNIYP
jgi:hypothetical protein